MSNTLDVIGVIGNGASYNVQMEAGVVKADLLIAVTSSDELNLLCCLIAKKAGNVHTIARVRNPVYREEINFINDLLSSDDVQLLTMNADVFKVLVSAQKVEQKLLQSVAPDSIQLNIQFVDSESYNIPGMIGNVLANRIFSIHFDQTFN